MGKKEKTVITLEELEKQINALQEGQKKLDVAIATLSRGIGCLAWKITPAKQKPIPASPEYYIGVIASGLKMEVPALIEHLRLLRQFNNGALTSLILRTIAIILDNRYEDNIRDTENVFMFSSIDSKIFKHKTSDIKSFSHVAAFRDTEEANFAVRMMSHIRHYINAYGKGTEQPEKPENPKIQSKSDEPAK